MVRVDIIELVANELAYAYNKHGSDQWGRHEFYAILKEEVDELWDVIKSDGSSEHVLDEMVDIIAMCIRYAETGNRYGDAL